MCNTSVNDLVCEHGDQVVGVAVGVCLSGNVEKRIHDMLWAF